MEYVWGYPGGAVLHIYDALFNQDEVRHILVRHEQGAVHMAEGYARSTGKTGVVLVTSGPGATNTVTGLTDEQTRYQLRKLVAGGQLQLAGSGRGAYDVASQWGDEGSA